MNQSTKRIKHLRRNSTEMPKRSLRHHASSRFSLLGHRVKLKSLYSMLFVPIGLVVLFGLMLLLSSGDVSTEEWDERAVERAA